MPSNKSKAATGSSISGSTPAPTSTSTSTAASASSSTSGSAKDKQGMTDYEFIKGGWGSKSNFMRSYGLESSDPDDQAIARQIIDEMRDQAGLGRSPFRAPEPGSSGRK